MGVPVILTPQSQEDLRDIVRYIAMDNAERARSFGNLLIDRALSIGSFPERGRIVPEVDDPSVREIIHGMYRIIYEIRREPMAVFVLRFWHSPPRHTRSSAIVTVTFHSLRLSTLDSRPLWSHVNNFFLRSREKMSINTNDANGREKISEMSCL